MLKNFKFYKVRQGVKVTRGYSITFSFSKSDFKLFGWKPWKHGPWKFGLIGFGWAWFTIVIEKYKEY